MSKEYRTMTAEERLRIINAALNKDGFYELKKIIGEYEILLKEKSLEDITDNPVHITDEKVETIRTVINDEGLAGFAGDPVDINNRLQQVKKTVSDTQNLEEGSIYAPEHREEAMTENGISPESQSIELKQPKTRSLEKTSSAPNPWGDAEVVKPGQLNL